MCHFARGGHVTGNNNHKVFPLASKRISRSTTPFATQLNERPQKSEYKNKRDAQNEPTVQVHTASRHGVTFFLSNL